ncbi:bifunctional 5,10-methylenetetrahydrofolate dehydrogenase/5,10-methenyltetrahydrofolate cyclohydrolase [Candidatus Roizmanbacteria bacterium]|nr:MAG: bifunctional 5,10-methylenetetrahydrofolate dehydrogenase/5,10-methenyltetrahydrofolate cyclohydrolase [Candidatus Roizmanbacteria bacterium]
MNIPCGEIAQHLQEELIQRVQSLKNSGISPKLVTILVGSEPEQLSFVNIKKRTGEKIGVEFELVHLAEEPSAEDFKRIVSEKARDPKTTGIIIQHPFPESYNTKEIYQLIPPKKEIEGHHPESTFHFPLSIAVLSGLKYIIAREAGENNPHEVMVNFSEDKDSFYQFLQNKNIVIAGRGITGGAPIAKALEDIGVSFTVAHSQTPDPQEAYKSADIIITATGRKIITPSDLREGVILLNVGLRKENGKLKGDYDEEEIRNIASYYTQTPGGLGPLDVLYLFKNVIEAAKV